MADLKCPFPESTKYLCDRQPAAYSIDGVIYCLFHAHLLMSRREMTRRDTPYYDADEVMALVEDRVAEYQAEEKEE